ncbi:hypothetical protein N7533_009052 [Penicillium manginii]|uniref:uncharacterized protein n=1 Tax=Penicillium manginii TaxID=203109 RepID=UPI00254811FB|nr:uncharacterized protein N7533_009052 [Penicillium manginii]KAJ5744182.1 hypothetical protein N7533_009052 [Penicillium manginii]
MSSTPNDAPQRATAAQLASRKIKDIRRRPRGTTPTGGADQQQQPTNAFGGLSTPNFSNPAPNFGAPPAQSGGFTFGQTQSQSFPGANSGPSQPSQPSQSNASAFSFGGGSSSSGVAQTGFNFGASSGGFGSSTFNNPFASEAGKAAPTPTTQSAPFTGFSFGNQPTSQSANPSQPAFSFGAPQTATPSMGSGMFGQSNAMNSSSTPADSMQMSPDAKPKTSTTTPSFQSQNLFGGSATNVFAPKPDTQAGNPFSNLNGTSTAEKPASDKPEGFAAKPAFAGQATPASNQAPQFGSLFGAPAAAAKPSESEKPAPTNMFGAGSSQSAFPGSSTAKPAAEKVTQNNIFAPKTDISADANPFKNLFGAGSATPQTSAPPAQAPPAQNLFAPKPATEQSPSKPAEAQSFTNMFGGAAASSTPKPAEPSAPNNMFSPKPALAAPSTSLFGAPGAPAGTPKPFEAPKEQPTPAQNLFAPKPTSDQPATNNLFASKSAADQASEKPSSSNPFGSLLGASAPKPNASEPEPAKPQSTPTANLFAASPAKPQVSTIPAKPLGGLFGAKPDTTSQGIAPSSSTSSNAKPVVAPPIPKSGLADSVDKSNSELLHKLRILDTIFKEELSIYEPGVDGFDGLIMHYLIVRRAMGAPVGSKNDWKTFGTAPVPNGHVAKAPTTVNGVNDSTTSNVFAQSFSSPAKATEPSNAAVKKPENPFAKLNTTDSGNSSKPAENPFAKIPTTTTGAASESAPKAAENPFAKIPTTTQTSTPAKKPETPAAPKLAGNMFASAQSSNANGSAAPLSMPKFGNGTGNMDFMAQFKKKAEETAAKEKAKRKAEDFDSDEDDEEEWERRDAEQQREKRAKLEGASNKKAVFIPGKGFSFVDGDEAPQEESSKKLALPAPSPAPSSGSIFDSSSQPVPASQNIFGRISSTTPQPAGDSNDSDASDEAKPRSPKHRASGDDNDEQDDSEPTGRKSKRTKAIENGDASKSSLDTPLPAPTAAASRSLFDRIESPTPSIASPKPTSSGINFGASTPSTSTNPFASLGANSQTSQLFGASFGTSSPQLASTTSPAPADNTWKPSTPIKFAADTNSTSAQASTEASAQTSGAENATPGAATPDEEGGAPGSIFDMSSANAGEEEETVVFECRARAFKLTTGWVSQGTGVVRLLKHPATGRARVVLRADPGGNIILNTLLKKELDYARTSNSMQFMVPQADGKPEQWAVRVNAKSIDALNEHFQAIKN